MGIAFLACLFGVVPLACHWHCLFGLPATFLAVSLLGLSLAQANISF